MERNLIQMPHDYFEPHTFECIDSNETVALDFEQVPAEHVVYAEVRRCCKGFRDPEYPSY